MKKRAVQRSLLVAAGVVLLAVVVFHAMSWNFLKPRITAGVEQATGREFFIAGDVELSLLPRPRITLHEVALANPSWAGPEHLIEIARLRVAPDLLALLSGQVALARVDIDRPVLQLIEGDNGRANWVLQGSGEDGQSDSDPMPIHRLNVSDADVRYRPAGPGEPLQLQLPLLRLRDNGETAALEAMVEIRDREIAIEAQTDSLFTWGDGAQNFVGDLEIKSDQSLINVGFTLNEATFPAEWELQVDADIANTDRWLDLVPGLPATSIGPVALEAQVARQQSIWEINELLLAAMDSKLEADLEIETAGERPDLSGSIRSSMLNIASLSDAWGSNSDSETDRDRLPLPGVLPSLSGGIDVSLHQIIGLGEPIPSFEARLRFGRHRLSLQNAEIELAAHRLAGSAAITSSPEAVSASLSIASEEVEEDATDLSSPSLEADLELQLNPVRRDSWQVSTIAEAIDLSNARLEYVNPGAGTELSAKVELVADGPQPVVDLNGTYKGQPLDARIEGAPLVGDWSDSGYDIAAQASSHSLVLSVETTLDSIFNIEQLQSQFSFSGDGVNALAPWLDRELIETPSFELVGQVERDAALWRVEDLSLDIGQSSLRGDVRATMNGQPQIVVALDADPLNLEWLKPESLLAQESDPSSETDDSARRENTTSPDLQWLSSFDADVEFAATRIELSATPVMRDFNFKAELIGGSLLVEQLRAEIAGGNMSVSGELEAQHVPASARINTEFEEIALGRLADTYSPLEERLGRMSGSIQAVVTQTLDEEFRADILAPMLGRLKIAPSQLRFQDAAADTDVRLTFRTDDLAAGDQHFFLEGSGRYDDAPFSLDFRSDALLGIRLPDRTYSFEMDANVVSTQIKLEGSLLQPLALGGLDLELDLDGSNPQRLSRLLGVPLPDLPAYDVSGQVGLTDNRWSISDLEGTVGASDLSGRLVFDTNESPPLLSGELFSERLHLEDLAAMAGADSDENGGQSSQADEGAEEAAERRILPQGVLLGEAWRRVEADVRYRGASVRAADIPLNDLVIDFELVDGLARLKPVGFGVADGEVDFSLELDVTKEPPQGDMTIEVRGVDLREALKDWDLADESVGIVGGQGKLWVAGESIGALLGSADGGMMMLMTEGQLGSILVELAGLDAGEALLSWLGEREAIPIDCVYVDLKARSGRVELDTFVVDTSDTVFTAGGHVDLQDERLDVSLVAHPQDTSVLVGRTPFHLGGTFSDIETGIHGGELALRLGASAGLATLAGPLAAALPLLETGGDESLGYCQGLTSRTKQAIEDDEDPL